MAVQPCVYSRLAPNGFGYTALNTTYYMLHYTLAATVSRLHSLPLKMSFFRLSQRSDVWVEAKYDLHLWSSAKFVIRVVSDKSTFEILFPTIPPESADSALESAIRSVCTHCACVCFWFRSDTMHKTLYCEKKSLQVFFNCVSTPFSCFTLNEPLCVSSFLINYSQLTTLLGVLYQI